MASRAIFSDEADKHGYAYYTILSLGVKFWGDFRVYLGGDIFSQRIGKMRRNRIF